MFATLATHDLRSPSTGWSYTAARPETDRWITKPAWSSACTARVSVASDWCVVQERIAGGRESKIYAIREKPLVPPDACYSKAELDQIEYVVSTCHSATGLAYFGIDIMWHADEPWIIDVNDMPSYRLVPDAAQEIITDILAIR